jgi:hypothetical protein
LRRKKNSVFTKIQLITLSLSFSIEISEYKSERERFKKIEIIYLDGWDTFKLVACAELNTN